MKMSNYANSLPPDNQKRYFEKLTNLGFHEHHIDDPYIGLEKTKNVSKVDTSSGSERKWVDDPTKWPKLEFGDIFTYFIDTPGPFTRENMRAHRSLDAYSYYKDGWVQKCEHSTSNTGIMIIRAKVLRSQGVTQDAHLAWAAIRHREHMVESGHCTCMAGLGEVCSHVAAILYKVEGFIRLYPELHSSSVTSEPCAWNQTVAKKIEAVPLAEIEFEKPKRIGESKTPLIKRQTAAGKEPLSADPSSLLSDLRKCAPNAVVFTVLEPAKNRPSRDHTLPPNLNLLYKKENSALPENDLRTLCNQTFDNLSSTVEQNRELERITRSQSKSGLWHTYRAGRITSSNFHEACHTSMDKPSVSLIKKIVHGNSFNSVATQWGNNNESVALDQYKDLSFRKHTNIIFSKCGFQIGNNYPFLGATPDSIVQCDCCGKGSVEIKCPHSLKDEHPCTVLKNDFYLSVHERGSDGICDSGLKYKHPYFYQIQGQMGLCDLDYCDFVCYTSKGLHIERIYFDIDFFKAMVHKLTIFYKQCIVPEVLTHSILTNPVATKQSKKRGRVKSSPS